LALLHAEARCVRAGQIPQEEFRMARERDYELGIVLAPETPDEQARAIVERITNAVTAQGGVVVRINAWGRRRLAYPIEHYRDGLYYFFDLQLPPASVVEIERLIGVNEDIIRHLMKARDPRVIGDERKRAEEAEIRARQEAEARAAAEAEAAARGETPGEAPEPVDAQPVGEVESEPGTTEEATPGAEDGEISDTESDVAEATEANS
jgi:small subunit ribosomal protein S6